MKFESFFRPKPKEEIQKQVDSTSFKIETDLIHEAMNKDLGLLDVKDLKEKYQLRYNTYLEMLRAERQGKELEGKDFERAKVWINALNNLDDYIQKQASGEIKVLRGRQVPIFNAIRDAFERGVTHGYVKLPTGVGKTVLFSQLIEALNLKTLIAVPSLPLVKQTSDKMETFTTKSYGTYTGKNKDINKDITTITYQSLINALKDNKIESKDFPIFVLDEAHKALGPETTNAIKQMEDSIQIGFTATPRYSEKHQVSNILEEEIYSMHLNEAIKSGLVNRTKTIHAFTNVDLSSVEIKNGQYDSGQLEKVINVHGRNMAALELYKNKFNDQKAIVNCSGVQHAKDVAKLFRENGIKAVAVYGDMSDQEKNKILGYVDDEGNVYPSMIETGEVDVITNAKLLLEGFDEQSISVALNLNPTLSYVDAEQRGGRPARLDDKNPEKWTYVIDFIDQNAKKKQVLFSEILESDIAEEEIDENLSKEEREQQERKERVRPIDLSDVNIDGLRIVVETNEIMEVTKENQESRIYSALDKKEGWENASALSGVFRAARETIVHKAGLYKEEHPEWFEMQKTNNHVSEHYSPELIQLLKKEFKNNTDAPDKKEGWENASFVVKNFKIHSFTLKDFVAKYKEEHPEWFEMQRFKNTVNEYYSPEFIEIIKKEFKNNVDAPDKKEGWESETQLVSRLRTSGSSLKKEAEKYREEHPEWFEIQRSGANRVVHYSPELIQLLEKEFKNNTDAPDKKEGWENIPVLKSLFNASHEKIKKEAEKYRQEHPEWFEIQRSGRHIIEHYSPELIDKLKVVFSKINSIPDKKEGWESASSLARLKLFKTSEDGIKKEAEKYREEHPEWFEIQKNKSSVTENYDPRLVALIINKFVNVSSPKAGWETASSLRNKGIMSFEKAKKEAEKYREEHPEWFEMQGKGDMVSEAYSPELVELIKKSLNK